MIFAEHSNNQTPSPRRFFIEEEVMKLLWSQQRSQIDHLISRWTTVMTEVSIIWSSFFPKESWLAHNALRVLCRSVVRTLSSTTRFLIKLSCIDTDDTDQSGMKQDFLARLNESRRRALEIPNWKSVANDPNDDENLQDAWREISPRNLSWGKKRVFDSSLPQHHRIDDQFTCKKKMSSRIRQSIEYRAFGYGERI